MILKIVQLHANHPEPREGKHILIENEWIKEIEDQPIKSNGADSIDLKGKTVIPGLIDAHCHIILSDLNISNTDSIPPTLATAMSTNSCGKCCSVDLPPSAMQQEPIGD